MRRYVSGCDAVHPDRRGGQHVAMSCSGVLAIDDEAELGVLVMAERSQFKNRARADELLDAMHRLVSDEATVLERQLLACTSVWLREKRETHPPLRGAMVTMSATAPDGRLLDVNYTVVRDEEEPLSRATATNAIARALARLMIEATRAVK
jgi:hypothetical protein